MQKGKAATSRKRFSAQKSFPRFCFVGEKWRRLSGCAQTKRLKWIRIAEMEHTTAVSYEMWDSNYAHLFNPIIEQTNKQQKLREPFLSRLRVHLLHIVFCLYIAFVVVVMNCVFRAHCNHSFARISCNYIINFGVVHIQYPGS